MTREGSRAPAVRPTALHLRCGGRSLFARRGFVVSFPCAGKKAQGWGLPRGFWFVEPWSENPDQGHPAPAVRLDARCSLAWGSWFPSLAPERRRKGGVCREDFGSWSPGPQGRGTWGTRHLRCGGRSLFARLGFVVSFPCARKKAQGWGLPRGFWFVEPWSPRARDLGHPSFWEVRWGRPAGGIGFVDPWSENPDQGHPRFCGDWLWN